MVGFRKVIIETCWWSWCEFVCEKLYYFMGKQRGVLFEIGVNDGKISPKFSNKLFKNKKEQ